MTQHMQPMVSISHAWDIVRRRLTNQLVIQGYHSTQPPKHSALLSTTIPRVTRPYSRRSDAGEANRGPPTHDENGEEIQMQNTPIRWLRRWILQTISNVVSSTKFCWYGWLHHRMPATAPTSRNHLPCPRLTTYVKFQLLLLLLLREALALLPSKCHQS